MSVPVEATHYPVPVADQIDKVILLIGKLAAWVYLILMAIIITQVVLRKGFHSGLITLEELQWHLYAVGFMVGIPYAQVKNSHVRVDLVSAHFSIRVQRVIEILGMLLFVIPLVYVVVYHSIDFVYDSWRIGERSDAPAGLPYRFIIKSVIPFAFLLLGAAALSRVIREAVLLVRGV